MKRPKNGPDTRLSTEHVRSSTRRLWSAITLWEPRVEILSVDANQDVEEPEKLRIDLQYRTRRTGRVDVLRYNLNLAGGVDR